MVGQGTVKYEPKIAPKSKNNYEMSTEFSNNSMFYITVGFAAISMGISVFLYREMNKIKSSINDISKEVKHNESETSKSIKTMEEHLTLLINQISQQQQQQFINQNKKVLITPEHMINEKPKLERTEEVVTKENILFDNHEEIERNKILEEEINNLNNNSEEVEKELEEEEEEEIDLEELDMNIKRRKNNIIELN